MCSSEYYCRLGWWYVQQSRLLLCAGGVVLFAWVFRCWDVTRLKRSSRMQFWEDGGSWWWRARTVRDLGVVSWAWACLVCADRKTVCGFPIYFPPICGRGLPICATGQLRRFPAVLGSWRTLRRSTGPPGPPVGKETPRKNPSQTRATRHLCGFNGLYLSTFDITDGFICGVFISQYCSCESKRKQQMQGSQRKTPTFRNPTHTIGRAQVNFPLRGAPYFWPYLCFPFFCLPISLPNTVLCRCPDTPYSVHRFGPAPLRLALFAPVLPVFKISVCWRGPSVRTARLTGNGSDFPQFAAVLSVGSPALMFLGPFSLFLLRGFRPGRDVPGPIFWA